MNIPLTPEQQRLEMEEVRQACAESRPPDPRRWGVEPRRPDVPQPVAAPTNDDVFTASDLTMEMLGQGREYTVPNSGGKRLWVFASTPEDAELMLSWSLLPDQLAAEPDEPNRALLSQAKLIAELKIAQVILCTRTGPTRDAKRCFARADRPALRSRLGNPVVEDICRISNELSGNEEALGASARRFFGCIRAYLQTSPSPSPNSANSPAGSEIIRTRLLSLVSRAVSRGSLDAALMTDLDDLEGLL